MAAGRLWRVWSGDPFAHALRKCLFGVELRPKLDRTISSTGITSPLASFQCHQRGKSNAVGVSGISQICAIFRGCEEHAAIDPGSGTYLESNPLYLSGMNTCSLQVLNDLENIASAPTSISYLKMWSCSMPSAICMGPASPLSSTLSSMMQYRFQRR